MCIYVCGDGILGMEGMFGRGEWKRSFVGGTGLEKGGVMVD